MFITFFDKSYAIENSTWFYYLIVFHIQFVIAGFVVLYYLLNVAIDISNKQYRTNIERIHHCIYLPCVSGHILCVVQRILLIFDFPEGTDSTNSTFYYISLFRAIFCFPGFYAISALVAERCFATYFLDDYEKNQRSWLVFIILFVIYAVGIVSAISFHNSSTTIPHILLFLLLCSIGILVNNFNFNLNKKYHKRAHRNDGGGYSLGQRFQIAENIRVSQFFLHFSKSVAFFTTVGPLLLLLQNFDLLSIGWKNLITVVFDFTVLMYAFATPYIVYYYNPKYQAKLQIILKKTHLKSQNPLKIAPLASKRQVQDIFGNQLIFDNTTQTHTYFRELNQSWEIRRK